IVIVTVSSPLGTTNSTRQLPATSACAGAVANIATTRRRIETIPFSLLPSGETRIPKNRRQQGAPHLSSSGRETRAIARHDAPDHQLRLEHIHLDASL